MQQRDRLFSFAMGMPLQQTMRKGGSGQELSRKTALRQEVATKGLCGGEEPVEFQTH